jgi:PKD repeat protein
MKQRFILTSICLLLILSPFFGALAADTSPREFAAVQKGFVPRGEKVLPYAPDRIMVKFKRSSIDKSNLKLGLQGSGLLPDAATGLSTLDVIGKEAGVRKISRAYIPMSNRALAERLGADQWFRIDLENAKNIPELVRRYEEDPNVEYAKPDYRAFPAAVPSDPYYDDHWGHNNTSQMISYDWSTHTHTGPTVGTPGFDSNAQNAWDVTYGDPNVIIAIIDSGVDIDHPDLNLVAGYDFGSGDSNPDDDSGQPGHGTCCAGVAASTANNGIGTCGIAPGCRIMPCKIANNQGSMYFSYIDNALYWAADNGADVISMSLGAYADPGDLPATDAALQYAWNAGCVILAATSNDNYSYISYPANSPYVIAVGAAAPCGGRKRSSSSSLECNPGVATDPNGYTCDGERWWGSCYGSTTRDAADAVDVIAPTIVPTTDIGGSGGYTSTDYDMWFNGTSCATPYAAGVCALIKSVNPTWTPAQIRTQLRDTAFDIVNVESGSGWDRYSGYGMVDAEAAVGGGGPVAPVAEFYGDPTSGMEPLLVSFTDQSTGAPTSWYWQFGDGGTSTQQNPSHTYNGSGAYTVTLTATNSEGSDDEVKVDYITVIVPPPPVAQFSGSPTSGEAPLTVSFTDESTNNPTSWSWVFGDGGTSAEQNPTYVYNDVGTYTVTLTATNAYGSDDEVKTGYINVTEPGVAQKNYAMSETPVTGTVSGDFTDTRAGDNVRESITEVQYTGHPRKTYSYLEHIWTFNVPSSSTVTFFLEAYRPASADGDNFVFAYSTDGAIYTDLVTVSSATEQVYSASVPASVSGTVYVRVLDTNRNWDMVDLDAIYIDEMYFQTETVAGPPVADFSGSPTTGYVPLTVDFTDLSTGAPDSWSWTFGDGGTSTAQNPSHTYNDVGTYTVTLTATNAYGSDGETKTGYIIVEEMTGTAVHVSDIAVTQTGSRNKLYGNATVTIVDQNSAPVEGATVYGHFDAPNTTTKSGVTGADGTVLIVSDRQKVEIDFCFTVDNVVHAGGTYDDGANLVTYSCESGDVYDAGGTLVMMQRETPETLSLGQNYPNPFNPVTRIEFGMPSPGHVRLDVYNVKGERVANLANGTYGSGFHTVEWNAAGMSSGIYFYRLVTPIEILTRKMILLR